MSRLSEYRCGAVREASQWDHSAIAVTITDCPRTIFLLQYQDKGRLPAVKQQIVDMTLNGSGCAISPVSWGQFGDGHRPLKKKSRPKQVNEGLLQTLDPAQVDVIVRKVEQPRWMRCGALWAAKASSGGCGMPLITTRDRS